MSRKVIVYVLLWLGLAAAAAGFFLYGYPSSWLGWLLLLILGPPVYMLFQLLGDIVGGAFNSLPGVRHGNEAVERRNKGSIISFARVAWYLLTSLIFLALFVGGSWLFRSYL